MHSGQRSIHQQRYLLAHWLPLLVASGDPRALAALEAMRGFVDGAVVESQFNAPYRSARTEAYLWAGEPARALAEAEVGLAEVATIPWHGFHVRLHRLGCAGRRRPGRGRPGRSRRRRRSSRPLPRSIACGPASGPPSRRCWPVTRPAWAASMSTGPKPRSRSSTPTRDGPPGSRRSTPGWTPRGAGGRATTRTCSPYARWHEAEARLAGGDRAGATESPWRGPSHHARPWGPAAAGGRRGPRRSRSAGARHDVGRRRDAVRGRRSGAGRSVRSDRPGARRPAAARGRPDEPADRRDVVRQREHGRRPRLEHPRQARGIDPDRGRDDRRPAAARPGRRTGTWPNG